MEYGKQLFKTNPPISIDQFYIFIHQFCEKSSNQYILSPTGFRQGMFHNKIQPFLTTLRASYFDKQTKYIDKVFESRNPYKAFVVVIRQLCKSLTILISDADFKYHHNVYDSLYYIPII